MRVIVVIVHYFHPEPHSGYSSLNAGRHGNRQAVVRSVLATWRHVFGASRAAFNVEKSAFEIIEPPDHVTVCVLTTQGRHLLDADFCQRHEITMVERNIDNPRYLGFEAANLFAEARHQFDLFVYSEDDLLVQDPLFLQKACWFIQRFGHKRLLMPNRFEWNPDGPAFKTYIDGDIARWATEKWWLPDDELLTADALGGRLVFRRARNPNSGMHLLTREQLLCWMDRPHWDDRDTSFVGPIESAANLGALKTFSIYKPSDNSVSFLEVEHLDRKFSSLPRVSSAADARLIPLDLQAIERQREQNRLDRPATS
jgi:hypothetical protein